jgi:homoserine kinase type II
MAYTEVSFDEASDFIAAAGFSGLLAIEKLSGGWCNSNYALSLGDGRKLVLKIWDGRTLEEVEHLLKVTSYLSDNGVPTPSPIAFDDGGLMRIRDGLAWTLLPFVEGEWLEPTPSSLRSLGRAQALLHGVEAPDFLGGDFSMGHKLFEEMFSIADESGEWTDFLTMLKSESDVLRERIGDLPRGVIHGDLFPDNVIGSDGEVTAMLDFEEVCHDILAFDLVMTFVGFGWEDGEPVAERWNSILDGYQSIRELGDDEIAALPDLHRLATLSIAAWRYWQFVINMPGSEHTDRYLEMTERLAKRLPF